jgi:DtxR family transcriptional regulator, Mn-dependent transcriptional regulator
VRPSFGRVVDEVTEQMQEYLETIYRLEELGEVARTGEIARQLNLGAPAVTDMLQKLEKAGLVTYEPYKGVVLTDSGRAVGRKILGTHRVMQAFLQQVCGMEHDEAHEAACDMEHHIPQELHDWMAAHLTKVLGRPLDLGRKIRDQL